MKFITIILLLLTFTACNPFISKDLREKNKCNRKLKRATKKYDKKVREISFVCPEIIQKDTIRDTTIVEIPKVEIDSFIVIHKDTSEIDSLVNLINNNNTKEIIREYILKYEPIKDTIIHLSDGYTIAFSFSNGKLHYSVTKPQEALEVVSEIVVDDVKPIELNLWEKLVNGVKDFWGLIVLFAILFIGLRYALSFLPKK